MLLSSTGKDIKNKQGILVLLEAIRDPVAVSIMHCPGHQKGEKPIALGNSKEDQEARKAALNKTETLVLEQK